MKTYKAAKAVKSSSTQSASTVMPVKPKPAHDTESQLYLSLHFPFCLF